MDNSLITVLDSPLNYLKEPTSLLAQEQVDFHHLNICGPGWSGREPPLIYTLSREAIALWLGCVPQEPSMLPLPPTVNEWSAELTAELAALLAAMNVASGSSSIASILYNCGMSFFFFWKDHDKP